MDSIRMSLGKRSASPPLSLRTAPRRAQQALAVLALALLPALASAQSNWAPSGLFVQGGAANHAQSATVGLTWDLPPHWELGPYDVEAYVEASVSEWQYHAPAGTSGNDSLTQFGLIPTLRLRPDHGASPWFAEIGIGATYTTSIYRPENKTFSTRFNFGDHLALGRNFGAHGAHELALRYEHFSNADIKRPNPGEDFGQLRYAYHFQ